MLGHPAPPRSATVTPRSAGLRAVFILLTAVTLPLLASCASTGTLGTDRVVVELYDSQNDLHLALANESHPDHAGMSSRLRADATLKLARDEVIGALLSDLDRLGFAETAQPGAPPQLARGWVSVSRGDLQASFVVPVTGATADQIMRFADMKLLLDDYYGGIGALQYVENPGGAQTLRNASRRIVGGGRP